MCGWANFGMLRMSLYVAHGGWLIGNFFLMVLEKDDEG
jgi:hypothetical protein